MSGLSLFTRIRKLTPWLPTAIGGRSYVADAFHKNGHHRSQQGQRAALASQDEREYILNLEPPGTDNSNLAVDGRVMGEAPLVGDHGELLHRHALNEWLGHALFSFVHEVQRILIMLPSSLKFNSNRYW